MKHTIARKKALITGITGQDGSFLAEILLEKGYEVHGIIRRTSTFNTGRIEHLYEDPHKPEKRLILHYGDLGDANSIRKLIYKVEPDEIYNLGAQSHVRVSFDIPEYTVNITGLGTLRILEAIKDYGEHGGKKKIKFYQASSSELFGASPPPQNEQTPFYPRSPYGCAKALAYYTTVNYREAYGIFAVNGILFNHETIASFMPMFFRKKGELYFDIKPIREIVDFDESQKKYQSRPVIGIQVWDKNGWTDVNFASAYPHDIKNDNKKPRFINARSGAFMATSSHVAFMESGDEKKTGDITIGDRLKIIELPRLSAGHPLLISEIEAELMGLIVGDGSITYAKKGTGLNAKFTNSSKEIRDRFDYLWRSVTGGRTVYYPSKSGFNPETIVGQLRLVGGSDWLRELDIYNQDKTKRVPKIILNSKPEIMRAFLHGYNIADGLKENLCTYEFKNFKTNSPALAMGLWYLIDMTTKQDINITLEIKEDGRIFYSLNILSTTDNTLKEEKVRELAAINTSQRGINRITGISRTFIRKIQYGGIACTVHHLKKDLLEVKKIIDLPEYSGWFYDLETSSGSFHCGVGKCHVHNSERRGETFVTRKITRGIARIKMGLDKQLYLGNLDARRDWGYAPEYVEAAWRMLQEKKPDDYVIGTGESHSIKDFLTAAFEAADMGNWKKYVAIDRRYFRPAEVVHLVADARKAYKILGWKPKTGFKDLVKIMVEHDLKKHGVDSKTGK